MNIILSPHFDDAVLSLGGLLAREGRGTLVATFFTGMPRTPLTTRWDTKCGFSDSTCAMLERAEEDKRSLHSFGVTDDRIRTYTHLEAEYRRGGGEPSITEPELTEALKNEIHALLREFASGPLNVFAPGFESHTDHALVKKAALAVAKTLPRESMVQFYCYQDVPYAFKILDRDLFCRIRDAVMHRDISSLLEHSVTHGAFAVTPHTIPLTEADMGKKLAGVAFYASQIPHLGEQFLEKLERFSAVQAHFLSPPDPYCEVTYALTP